MADTGWLYMEVFLWHKGYKHFGSSRKLFNNVSTLNNLRCIALHAISVCDIVQKYEEFHRKTGYIHFGQF